MTTAKSLAETVFLFQSAMESPKCQKALADEEVGMHDKCQRSPRNFSSGELVS